MFSLRNPGIRSLSSDQTFLVLFKFFYLYSVFHHIFCFLNCLLRQKGAFIMSITSKVKGLQIAIRTGHLQHLTFFNKENGGRLTFPAISCQHSFSLLQSLSSWASEPNLNPSDYLFSFTVSDFICRKLLQNIYPSQRCHYPFPDWFLTQNQQKMQAVLQFKIFRWW